jgi:hypothetical protein
MAVSANRRVGEKAVCESPCRRNDRVPRKSATEKSFFEVELRKNRLQLELHTINTDGFVTICNSNDSLHKETTFRPQ